MGESAGRGADTRAGDHHQQDVQASETQLLAAGGAADEGTLVVGAHRGSGAKRGGAGGGVRRVYGHGAGGGKTGDGVQGIGGVGGGS